MAPVAALRNRSLFAPKPGFPLAALTKGLRCGRQSNFRLILVICRTSLVGSFGKGTPTPPSSPAGFFLEPDCYQRGLLPTEVLPAIRHLGRQASQSESPPAFSSSTPTSSHRSRLQ